MYFALYILYDSAAIFNPSGSGKLPPILNIVAYLVEWTWLDGRVADEIEGALNVQTELRARHKCPDKVVSKFQFSV